MYEMFLFCFAVKAGAKVIFCARGGKWIPDHKCSIWQLLLLELLVASYEEEREESACWYHGLKDQCCLIK